MTGPYDDIIELPHHVSKTRTRMSLESRASQFAPFAALTGFDAAVRETARFTEIKTELGGDAIADLDLKLRVLAELDSGVSAELRVTHFRPDLKKDGGAYVTSAGTLKKLDKYERVLVLTSGERIAIDDISDIECGLFEIESN